MQDKERVISIANIARLDLNKEETEKFTADLSEIFDYFKKLDSIDTKGIIPSFHPVRIQYHSREDKPRSKYSQKEALSNSKNTVYGYIKGPKIV